VVYVSSTTYRRTKTFSKRALVGVVESLPLSSIPSFEIECDFHKKKMSVKVSLVTFQTKDITLCLSVSNIDCYSR
jgi:hypothetical protein